MSLFNDAENRMQKAAHNAAQYPAANGSKRPQNEKSKERKRVFLPSKTALCGAGYDSKLPETGVEPARPEGH